MKHNNKNFFWLSHACNQRNYSATRRGSLINRLSTTFVFLFLLVLVLIFACWIDLGPYSSNFFRKALQNFNIAPTIRTEYPMNCTAWNQTHTCPKNYPKTYKPLRTSSSTCPEYFRMIYEDLKHWKDTGITRETIEKASQLASFRIVILNGKIYFEEYKPCFQTRAKFTTWGLIQLLRFYPGKLPDLELFFYCGDRAVIRTKDYPEVDNIPPPMFGYCADVAGETLSIVFPDWSFWGWAELNIKPWRINIENLVEGNKRTKWEERVPYAYWKGNHAVAPWRVELMKCNLTREKNWNSLLYKQDWDKEMKAGFNQSKLEDQCIHRYKIFIEGWGWSVSDKFILACNSPTLMITPRFYDFFIRGLVPQKHYWPISNNDICKSLKFAVEWGNNHTDKAQAIGEAGSHFIQEEMKMEYIYDYMFHLLTEYSKLLKFKPIVPQNATEVYSESLACTANGNSRKFMELSLEKSPSDSEPCTILPPYDQQGLKDYFDQKNRSISEVEGLVNEYWENHSER